MNMEIEEEFKLKFTFDRLACDKNLRQLGSIKDEPKSGKRKSVRAKNMWLNAVLAGQETQIVFAIRLTENLRINLCVIFSDSKNSIPTNFNSCLNLRMICIERVRFLN